MPSITKLFTLNEAAEHDSSDDCWIIVDGKVYDVTKYLDDHPGGDDILLNSAGKDATEEFEDAGHSKSARELMQDFLIGEIDSSPVINELEIVKKEQQSLFNLKVLDKLMQFWAFPLAAIGISVVAGLLLMRKR